MNSPGTTVYVHWYGKVLQGTVVNGHDLMGTVAVRIPLQGCHPVALFTPAHVYESETAAKGIRDVSDHSRPLPTSSDLFRLLPTSSTKANPSEAWLAIQKFKEEHWDQERNRLQTDHLEEFYQLWRAAVAFKYGIAIETGETVQYAAVSQQPQPEQVAPPPIVTERHYQEPRQQMAVKPTKKQLRSTGRVEYTDSIQTSLFD